MGNRWKPDGGFPPRRAITPCPELDESSVNARRKLGESSVNPRGMARAISAHYGPTAFPRWPHALARR